MTFVSKPAKRTQRDQIGSYLKRQAWVLLVLIVGVWLVDSLWFKSALIVTRSMTLGALLSYSTQAIFASFVFWQSGYRARLNIVSQMYRGQLIKWLITVLGFALIFIFIKPLSAPALFFGFIIMKISHSWLLLRLK